MSKEFEMVLIAKAGDIELKQCRYDLKQHNGSACILLFRGKEVAWSGCGCCGDDLDKDEALAMILALGGVEVTHE